MREAIELAQKRDSELETELAKQLRTMGVDQAFLAVWINPRSWDADLASKIEKATPTDAARLRQFGLYWKALDSAAAAITLDKDLILSLALRGKVELLPTSARRYFAAAARALRSMACHTRRRPIRDFRSPGCPGVLGYDR